MKNILLVVDMQKGFARYEQTIQLTNKIRSLLEKKVFDAVIATRFLNNSHSVYEKFFSWKRLITEEDRQLADGYEQYIDYIEDKNIYSCVTASFLQRLCQINDGQYPTQVYLVGADTDCCILTIATALFEHNIRPIVLTRYCDSNGGPDAHRAGITCMRRLIGPGQLSDVEITSKTDLSTI